MTAAEDDGATDAIVTLTHSAAGAGYEAVSVPAVAVTVLDRLDPQPRASIADARGMEAAGELVFDVTLDRPATRAVSVEYETRDGTARAGEDYEAGMGTATIGAGEDSAQIAVPLRIDLFSERDETFEVMLVRAEGVRLEDALATGTIAAEAAAATRDSTTSAKICSRCGATGCRRRRWGGSPAETLSAEFAYGFEAFDGVGMPWLRLGRTATGEEYRLGYGMVAPRGTVDRVRELRVRPRVPHGLGVIAEMPRAGGLATGAHRRRRGRRR